MLAVSLLLSGFLSCTHGRGDGPALPSRGTVVLEPQGRTVRVSVEIARTPEEQERGLMFRRSLEPSAGMLFLYGQDRVHSFWMKNTFIPLDIVFIGSDLRVMGAVQDAEPLTTSARAIGSPSRHVLEVNAGFVRTHGIEPGTRVRFEGIESGR
jgi:uncharacterized membrane protein (UPF0127 family)